MIPLVSLGELGDGGLFRDGDWVESKDQDPSGSTRLTQLADVGIGIFRDRSDRWMRDDQAERLKCTLLKPADILIARMPDPLGRACLVPPNIGRAVTVVDVAVLRLETSVALPAYVMWMINAPQFNGDVLAHQSGTTRKRISRKNLARLSIPLPEVDEQRRIVEILEDHLSHLDAAADYASAAIGRGLENLRASTWKRTFVDSAHSPVPLASVVTIANGQTPKGLADRLVAEASASTVPFYKVGDMNAGDGRYMSTTRTHIDKETAKSLGLHIRGGGTVLIPKRGGAIATNKKRVLRAPAAYDLNTMGLVPSPGLNPLYLWHWLQGIDLGKLADGSQVPQINGPQIRGLAIPLPAHDVQTDVVASLELELEARTRLAAATAAGLRRNDTLRRAVLAAAFSGELTGHRTDDEVIEELAEAMA